MKSQTKRRPSRAELPAYQDHTIRDVIGPGLDLLFVGINPSLYSAATGHHFARPGNRFWPALHAGGITDRQVAPHEQRELLAFGCGITNVVARATARADELSDEEIRAGMKKLRRKVYRYRPKCVVFLGVTVFRAGFNRPHAAVGAQDDTIASSGVYVLPNPSGLNAHYQISDFARLFRELQEITGRTC